jgi:hypothetical protein
MTNNQKMLEIAKEIISIRAAKSFNDLKPLLKKYLGSDKIDPVKITQLTLMLGNDLADLVISNKINENVTTIIKPKVGDKLISKKRRTFEIIEIKEKTVIIAIETNNLKVEIPLETLKENYIKA